jgi:hypothetical protein
MTHVQGLSTAFHGGIKAGKAKHRPRQVLEVVIALQEHMTISAGKLAGIIRFSKNNCSSVQRLLR